MACKTCGDKPKDGRHFPSAVVEINNPESLVLLRKVVIPASMGDDTTVPPAIGKYRNVVLVYEANDHIYLYSSDGIPTKIDASVPQEVLDRITELELDVDLLETSLAVETDARERADQGLQQEIDDLKNSPDVVDIVATYADLMAYDTSTLGDKDIIRVLRDETHEGQSDYYRWSTSPQTWAFIGTVGDYYTKQQVDTLLDGKQDELTPGENVSIEDESGALVISATDTKYTAGNNVQISPQNVISATDTTYTHFTGATASTDGIQGLVPGPLAGDEDKYLKGDGTWGTVQAGPTVVQTTGTSTTDVMSQNAVTGMVFADPARKRRVRIGEGSTNADYAIGIGEYANASAEGATALGQGSAALIQNSTAIGAYASARDQLGTVALGAYSGGLRVFTAPGMVHIGTSQKPYGYNSSNYRLLTGLYDPQNDHDAATKGYVDTAVDAKQDELTAGTGISIADESGALVISATGAEAETINAQDWSNLWQ